MLRMSLSLVDVEEEFSETYSMAIRKCDGIEMCKTVATYLVPIGLRFPPEYLSSSKDLRKSFANVLGIGRSEILELKRFADQLLP